MKNTLLVFVVLVLLSSCSRGFEPIDYGKDACAYCKMTIVDNRYASELVTEKGKPFKFDDIVCMKGFISDQKLDGKNQFFVCNFLKAGEPIAADRAVYLQHEFFQSPMNGNYAAFGNLSEAKMLMDSLRISSTAWQNIN